ncbi:hypothetical protein Barb6_03546 [Bacteroidales bacterium Barb6]|nr:hypothetical protein Barb6_03546 [Bacteroidales bacterium Barb6]
MINDGNVMRIWNACQKKEFVYTEAIIRRIGMPLVRSQKIVYGSVTKLAGVTAIKKDQVKAYIVHWTNPNLMPILRIRT